MAEARACVFCGAALPAPARFCAGCGREVPAEAPPTESLPPPSGPPSWPPPGAGPPTEALPPPSWPPPAAATPTGSGPVGPPPPVPPVPPTVPRSRRGVVVGGLVALAAVAAGGIWLATRDDGGSKTASTAATTASPASESTGGTEATEATTADTTAAETTIPETTIPETTTSEPGRADEYLGLAVETLEQASMPTGVDFVGGALVAPDYSDSVSQVSDSAGGMFWLLRPRGTEPDGSLVDWEVVDAVRLPDGGRVDDIVVLGDMLCRLGSSGGEVPVAAVFQPSLEDFVSDSRAAWFVNTGAGRFEWIDGVVSCANPGAGI